VADAKKPGVVEIETSVLLGILKAVLPAIEGKVTLPTLSGVLIRAAGGRLVATGTDLEMQFQASAEWTGEDFALCVPARRLREVLDALPSHILFELPAEPAGKLTVRAGKGRWVIPTFDPETFPAFDHAQSFKGRFFVGAGDLKTCLSTTKFAMARQDIRYYLNGACLSLGEGELIVQASDGYRAAQAAADIAWDEDHVHEAGRMAILPRKFVDVLVSALAKGDEQIAVTVREGMVSLVLPGDLVMSTKLIEGRYPDFGRVMPKDFQSWMEVDGEALAALFKRVIVPDNQYHSVSLDLEDDALTLRSETQEQQAEDSIPVAVREGTATAGFNGRYWLDAVNALGGKAVKAYFSNCNGKDGGAVKIVNPELPRAWALVMGMRL
jgi:DNA polymerase-3 subunit beta